MTYRAIPLFSKTQQGVPDIVVTSGIAKIINAFKNEYNYIVKRRGLDVYIDITGVDEPVRGVYHWKKQDITIASCNGRLYLLDITLKTATLIAGDSLADGVPVFSENGDGSILFIADGGRLIRWDGSGNANYEPSITFNVSHVARMNRITIVNRVGDGRWYFSDTNATAFTPGTDYFNAEAASDDIKGLVVVREEAFFLGTDTGEYWYHDGITFKPKKLIIPRGTEAANSLCVSDDIIYFLDSKRQFIQAPGAGQEVIVSSNYRDEFEGLETTNDCMATPIRVDGHSAIRLDFPSDSRTFVYDIVYKDWFEWSYWDTGYGIHKQYLGNGFCYIDSAGLTLMGDRRFNGQILVEDKDTYQDDSDAILVAVTTGHIDWGVAAMYKYCSRMYGYFKRGIANAAVLIPKVMFRWRDNRRGWNNKLTFSLGQTGEYEIDVNFGSCGRYKSRQIEVSHSDATEFVMMGLAEDNDPEEA